MTVRVVVKSSGAKALLRSSEVAAMLGERASSIAADAGDGFESESEIGANRARAAVWTASMRAIRRNARDNVLLRALSSRARS